MDDVELPTPDPRTKATPHQLLEVRVGQGRRGRHQRPTLSRPAPRFREPPDRTGHGLGVDRGEGSGRQARTQDGRFVAHLRDQVRLRQARDGLGVRPALQRHAHRLRIRGLCDARPSPASRRERFESWPRLPLFRDECAYEELSFAWNLRRVFRPEDFDLTLTCGYPFLNWGLRAGRRDGRPRHVFVTQNGDWPACCRQREYRFFSCDGLICVNPLHQERNRARWRCSLIPNGVDLDRFKPSAGQRERFQIPSDVPVVLMVSALIASKNVAAGIRAVAKLPGAFLVVAGDGPLREQTDRLADAAAPGSLPARCSALATRSRSCIAAPTCSCI